MSSIYSKSALFYLHFFCIVNKKNGIWRNMKLFSVVFVTASENVDFSQSEKWKNPPRMPAAAL